MANHRCSSSHLTVRGPVRPVENADDRFLAGHDVRTDVYFLQDKDIKIGVKILVKMEVERV